VFEKKKLLVKLRVDPLNLRGSVGNIEESLRKLGVRTTQLEGECWKGKYIVGI
jgi:hypothetical protein